MKFHVLKSQANLKVLRIPHQKDAVDILMLIILRIHKAGYLLWLQGGNVS